MDTEIIIVDKDDKVIGTKTRSVIDYDIDIYRVAALWITNSQGEILIAQRTHTKSHDPGRWSSAVVGTVEAGETYESNIYKEAQEEIGLTGYIFTIGPKQFVSHPKRFFVQWFFCVVDRQLSEFVLQKDEVEQVRWIGKEELLIDLSSNPENYVGSLPGALQLLLPR